MKASSTIGNITQIAVRNHADLQNVTASQHHPTPGIALTVSDTLRNSNDTERSTALLVYTKLKEILLNAALPVCRIKFQVKSSASPVINHARIYKDGVAIGTERTHNGVAYVEYTEDFPAGFNSGDKLQIYAYIATGYTVLVNNFRLCYSNFVITLGAETLLTPVETTTNVAISATNQDP